MDDGDKTGPPFYLPLCFLSRTMTCSPRGREDRGQGPQDSFSSSHWMPAVSLAQCKGLGKQRPPPGQHGHVLEWEIPEELEGPGSGCHSGAAREDEGTLQGVGARMKGRQFWTSVPSLRPESGREGERSGEVRDFHPPPRFHPHPAPHSAEGSNGSSTGTPSKPLGSLDLAEMAKS